MGERLRNKKPMRKWRVSWREYGTTTYKVWTRTFLSREEPQIANGWLDAGNVSTNMKLVVPESVKIEEIEADADEAD